MALGVGIIGATGRAGKEITDEAISEGLYVTAIVRNKEKAQAMFGTNVVYVEKDAMAITAEDLAPLDVVVDAYATGNPANAHSHVELAERLVKLVAGKKMPRLFFLLGAGSLKISESERLVDQLATIPGSDKWIAVPQEQFKEYQMLEKQTDINWVAISPAGTLSEGPKSDYTLGNDYLLKNDAGKSETTYATLAEAVISEIESPTYHNQRFTLVNK